MRDGYAVIPNVLSDDAISDALKRLEMVEQARPEVMSAGALFAIRNVFTVVPDLLGIIWNERLGSLVRAHVGKHAFVTRSTFFDKPPLSNWAVAPHQDISISVDRKAAVDGFSGWTTKHGLTGVVPPVHFLERTLTIRLHFDGPTERTVRSTWSPDRIRAGYAVLSRPWTAQ